MEISEIIQKCMECRIYQRIEWVHLSGGPEQKYSKSDEVIAELEDNDVDTEKYCTNMEIVNKHDELSGKLMQIHVFNCEREGCKLLKQFRHDHNVKGY